MGEGQWRLDDGLRSRIDELDVETEHAVTAGDEAQMQATLRSLHELVRESGAQLDDDHIGVSDLVVPPADLSLAEARQLLHGDGLIPELP